MAVFGPRPLGDEFAHINERYRDRVWQFTTEDRVGREAKASPSGPGVEVWGATLIVGGRGRVHASRCYPVCMSCRCCSTPCFRVPQMLSPTTVFLLRGNHESPNLNGSVEQYGDSCFRAQCQRVFGSMSGYAIWQVVLQVPACPLPFLISHGLNALHRPQPVAPECRAQSPLRTKAMGVSGTIIAKGLMTGSVACLWTKCDWRWMGIFVTWSN